ncbi:hypothetical protein ACN20G_33940 (plasmid) [Streptomyces sp. BI20]|uniref:hypothetical protein n=1 Tax=Streptomyces sp. BI20 TaxID=3403460 RepID=UPI003C74FDF5
MKALFCSLVAIGVATNVVANFAVEGGAQIAWGVVSGALSLAGLTGLARLYRDRRRPAGV